MRTDETLVFDNNGNVVDGRGWDDTLPYAVLAPSAAETLKIVVADSEARQNSAPVERVNRR